MMRFQCARFFRTSFFTFLSAALALALSATPKEPPKASDILTRCKELEASILVSQIDNAEMEKIGKDFGATYRMKNLHLYYQNPDKIRLETRSRVYGDALLIINGAKRRYAVSKLNIRKLEILDKDVAKRQSLLEYGGQLSEGTLQFMTAVFLKEEMAGDAPALVFELKYKTAAPSSYYRVWVDPKTRLTLKRLWYDKEGKLKASFLYSAPKEIGEGVWVPGRCEIRNAEGALAATLDFKEAKVASALDAGLFEITP